MEKVVHVPASKEKITFDNTVQKPVTPETVFPLPEDMPKQKKNPMTNLAIFVVVVVVAGIATGFGAARLGSAKGTTSTVQSGGKTMVAETQTEAGTSDLSAFPDVAEGDLKEAPAEAEGSHYLDRGTGKDKYVYLTSTVLNLQNFVGKHVQVNGQTLASGKKTGWLMDVGRIKVIQ